jgi:hypothetical protein
VTDDARSPVLEVDCPLSLIGSFMLPRFTGVATSRTRAASSRGSTS